MEERIIIIDDDPTGCQTVRDIPLLLVWDVVSLREALLSHKVFFILTNSRSMPPSQAASVSEQLCRNLQEANAGQFRLLIMSRGDSTLRGHTLIETQAIINSFGPFDAMLLCPAFFEAGRYTIGGTHYLRSSEGLMPVAESEFAQDPVFAYHSSYLPEWISEASEGYYSKSLIIDRATIDKGEDAVYAKLSAIDKFCVVVIDAISYSDLSVVDAAVKRAENSGMRFFYRTAASMVRTRISQGKAPLYQADKRGSRALIVVGSYTRLSTSQIQHLLESREDIKAMQIPIEWAIDDSHIEELSRFASEALQQNSCLLYTSRDYAFSDSLEDKQLLSKRVSDYIDKLVKSITTKPDCIIAKGGITSYSIAKNALGTRRATVKGQIADAVPIWHIEDLDIDYVVFPGNVGEASSLTQIVNSFK